MSDPQNLLVIAAVVAIVLRLFWRTLATLVGVTLLTLVFVGVLTFVTETRTALGR